MDKYTKVSDSMVAKYGLKMAYIYAKLCYRMNLSNNNNNFKDNNGRYIVYKVNDLAKDCHMSRGTIIRFLNKLEHIGLIYKNPSMFCNHIYLPKYNCESNDSSKMDKQSSKSGLSIEHNTDNKELDNNYVSSSSVHVSHSPKNYPKMSETIKKYGKALFNYAIDTYHKQNDKTLFGVRHPYHFIVGILRRWQYKGIKTVNDAMISEKDQRAILKDDKGPNIPIFKI